MKIAYVNSLYFPNALGGAEYNLRALIEYVREQGHDTVVLCTEQSSKDRVEKVKGVRVYYIGLKNVYWPFDGSDNPKILKPLWHTINVHNLWMAAQVRKVLEAEKPDLVHTQNVSGFSPAIWSVTNELDIPVIHTIQDYQLLCPTSMRRGSTNCSSPCLRCYPFALHRRKLSRYVNAATGCSRYVLDRHIREGFFPNVSTHRAVYNVHQEPIQDEVKGRKVGEGDQPLRLGFIGRIRPAKGIGLLLEYLHQYRSERQDWMLRIAGSGKASYEQYLRTRFDNSNIEFLGHTDAGPFLDSIDVLIVPSLWHEPFGIVVVEALAHGVPVLGARRGGIPEILDGKRCGWLFDPDRPEEFFKNLRRILNNREKLDSFRATALERSRDFTPSSVFPEYIDIYERVLDCHSGERVY